MEKDKQKKAKYEALKFLKKHNTMVVASISENLEPEAATVYYIVDDNFNFYFMTFVASRKSDNLRMNGKIAFAIGQGPEVITIQGGGTAKELEKQEAQTFYGLIKKTALKSANQWPILQLAEKGYATFKIEPTWLIYLNMEKEVHPEIASEEFYKII